LPTAYGWIEPLAGRLQEDGVGATGPMLLYEDDSIQHAGMYFTQDSASDHSVNRHYFKGYPRTFASAHETRIVPALTGACLMITRPTFEKIGGFSTDYVIGDYEDSDICLKLRQEGLLCLYCGNVALYHLERQSMERHEGYRHAVYRYNALLHHRRWESVLAGLRDAA
jgi:GT2 family glycosyltransferase